MKKVLLSLAVVMLVGTGIEVKAMKALRKPVEAPKVLGAVAPKSGSSAKQQATTEQELRFVELWHASKDAVTAAGALSEQSTIVMINSAIKRLTDIYEQLRAYKEEISATTSPDIERTTKTMERVKLAKSELERLKAPISVTK